MFGLLFTAIHRCLAAGTLLFIGVAAVTQIVVPLAFDPTYASTTQLLWWFAPEVVISTAFIACASAAMATGNSRLLVMTSALRLFFLGVSALILITLLHPPYGMAAAVGLSALASNAFLLRKLVTQSRCEHTQLQG